MRPDLMMLGASLLASATPAMASTSFPNSLQAQWTDDLSKCSGEDTVGMLVGSKRINFYEAEGTPKSVRMDNDGVITAELAYRGEGKTWTEANRYVISSDRASVLVTALGRTFTLKRCV